MTAVLAAAARAVIGAVLLLAFVAAMLYGWAGGPQGWPLVVALVAVCAVVTGAGLCASALQPRTAPVSCSCLCGCPSPGRREPDWSTSWCDPCRMNIHQEAR